MKNTKFWAKYISGFAQYFTTLRDYGVSGITLELRNRRSIFRFHDVHKQLVTSKGQGSSISDVDAYVQICELASRDAVFRSTYKRCHEYRLVLEHVSRSQGDQYLKFVMNDDSLVSNMLDVANKEVGSPLKYPYVNIGIMSPTQIRYGKILRDIKLLFGDLNGFSIAEIGVGSGGQAEHICNYWKVAKYALIDLEPVLELTKAVMNNKRIGTSLEFLSPTQIHYSVHDLFISNYAFSELRKKYQDEYFEKVIASSSRGYMLYNHIHEDEWVSYSALEISSRIPGSLILEESPKTFNKNVLIVWGFEVDAIRQNFVVAN
jgi:hypothetical protein